MLMTFQRNMNPPPSKFIGPIGSLLIIIYSWVVLLLGVVYQPSTTELVLEEGPL